MTTRSTLVALALSVFGVLALSSLSASAAIVCNSDGDCWHTPKVYTYPPGAHIVIHPDKWRWGAREHFTFKEHEGPGYWMGGHWTVLP